MYGRVECLDCDRAETIELGARASKEPWAALVLLMANSVVTFGFLCADCQKPFAQKMVRESQEGA